MTARQRDWPRAWLMTDERMGEKLWTAIDRMPIKHSGIVFRHYSLAEDVRGVLARRIVRNAVKNKATNATSASQPTATSMSDIGEPNQGSG